MNSPLFTTLPAAQPAQPLAARYAATRQRSQALIAPLSAEDCSAQSMPDASPVARPPMRASRPMRPCGTAEVVCPGLVL